MSRMSQVPAAFEMLLSGYLHQDAWVEYPSLEEMMDDFLAGLSKDQRAEIAGFLEQLCHSESNNSVHKKLYKKAGVFLPVKDFRGFHLWFVQGLRSTDPVQPYVEHKGKYVG